jgi:hypothetical protein
MKQPAGRTREARLRRMVAAAAGVALLVAGAAGPVVFSAAPASASVRSICKEAVREHDFYVTRAMELCQDAMDASGSKRRELLRRADECDHIAGRIKRKYPDCF